MLSLIEEKILYVPFGINNYYTYQRYQQASAAEDIYEEVFSSVTQCSL